MRRNRRPAGQGALAALRSYRLAVVSDVVPGRAEALAACRVGRAVSDRHVSIQRLDRPRVVLDGGTSIGRAAALGAHFNGDRTIHRTMFGEVYRMTLETHGFWRHDGVLRRLHEGGFEIDSDVFGESADSVAARGTAELQAGRPA